MSAMWMRGGMLVGGDMMIAPGRGWWFGGGNNRWLAVDVTRPESPSSPVTTCWVRVARSVLSPSVEVRYSPPWPAMSGCRRLSLPGLQSARGGNSREVG